jgi:ABC-2 type transport system permease protein
MMRKYLTVLRIGLADRFAYRANFFLGTLMRLLPFVTVVFFWEAVMAGAPADAFEGYDRRSIVGYFVLVFLARAFSSMPGLARETAKDIREGGLNRYLVRPIDYGVYQLLLRASHKTVYLATLAVPFGVFVWLMSAYFPDAPGPERIAAGLAALLLAFVIGFHFHLLMGLLGFWFLEVTTFLFVVDLIEYLLSGQMIPLDLLPEWARTVSYWLPFQYTAFVPAAILIGRIPAGEVGVRLLIGVGWAVVFAAATRLVFARGVRRYAAYGG